MPETLLIVVIAALAAAYIYRMRKTDKLVSRQQADSGRMHGLIEATVGTTGETYFYALVRELAQFLDIDAVFLASSVDGEEDGYRSLAYWCDGSYIMNHALSLPHNLGGEGGNFWHLENSAAELFANAKLLRERFTVSGFFAVRLQDSSGRQIGLLAGMHRTAMHPLQGEVQMIKMLAARASSELERKMVLGETLMEKERAQITLHSIGEGVITTDVKGCIDYMNPVAEELTGWRFHQAMGLSMEAVVHLEEEQSGEVVSDPAQRCLAEKRVIRPQTDNVLIARSGKRRSIQGTAAPMTDTQGNCLGVVLVFRDVSMSRRMEKQMVHQATHDPLTGLVNRMEFEHRLEQALQSAKDFENTHALLFLDLDQFKQVNDSAGHVAGDELLKQVSALLSGQLRTRDTLGRLGGDEFAVLLNNCPLSKAGEVASLLINAIREYRFAWDQKTYRIGVSIGIVPIRAESESCKQLMHDADQACYVAKDQGRGCAHIHNEAEAALASRLGEKLQRKDIDDALTDERFLLLYQPVVALGEAADVQHVEVLLRMLDENNKVITPGAFLPAASRFGLLTQIDRWVIGRVFRGYAHLFIQNPQLLVSLNLSASSIADESLANYIEQQLNDSVVRPQQLCFEMSEAIFGQNKANASKLIEHLRGLGCRIALDNFGSGLANFTALKQLPLDYIKIDGQLIGNVGSDDIDLTMVTAINTMSHQLGIRTIAENIDDHTVLKRLREIGIDFAQGFHVGDLQQLEHFGASGQQQAARIAYQLN